MNKFEEKIEVKMWENLSIIMSIEPQADKSNSAS